LEEEVSTNSDSIYWESDDNTGEQTIDETPTIRQAPMRKIITRNVGNTQRRRFR
jgi:hypothetical protein